MKPIYLELAGWGPYKNKELVDFEKLGGKGLFLVTGQTGAGKSTIFDAISYALFGKASGESRKDLNFRSDFADIDDATYVNLTFSHHGKIYRVSRNPEYERKARRGTGSTKNKADALLEIGDGKGNFEGVCSGVTDVTKEIESLIGVNYDQFKLIAFLPQGEFQKLLLADSGERSKIFRGIFNARIYSDIQKKMNDKTRDLKYALAGLDDFINEAINNADVEGDEWRELVNTEGLKNRNTDKVIETLAESIKADKDLETSLEKESKDNDAIIEKLSIKLEEAGRIANLKTNLDNARKSKADLEEKREEMNLLKDKCLLAETYLRISPSYELFKQTEKSLAGAKENAIKLKESLESLAKEKETNDALLKDFEAKLESIEENKKLVEDIDQLGKFVNNYVKTDNNYKAELAVFEKAEEAKKKAKANYENALEAKSHAAIGLLVKNLEDGKPCPVCGSLEHPKPNKAYAEDAAEISDEEIEEYKEELEEKEAVEKKVHDSCAGLYSLLTEYKNRFSGDEFARLRGRFLIDDIEGAKARGSELSAEKKKIEAELKEFDKGLEKAKNDKLESEKNYSESAGREAENKKELSRLEDALVKDKDNFENKLKESSFKDVEDFLAAKMSEKELNDNKNAIDSFEKDLVALSQSIKDLETALEGAVQIDTSDLKEKKQEADEKKKLLSAKIKTIHARYVKNEGQLKNIKKYRAQKQEKDKVYEKLSRLNNLMQGYNDKRIKFEDYVLMIYFERILRAANKRFKLMSEERYTFHRKDDNISKQSRGALEIEVFDKFTGKLRPVASLSGGEMFKAALSLSFGLSDIIQQNAGGIEIDTLFVDEGFGSLDNQSLDVAIAALTTVSKDSRLVGIISHVDELKTRIDTQICIEKTKLGSRIIQ